MANSRMFSRSLMNQDDFLELSASSRDLYVYLCIEADDFGFNNNPKSICRVLGSESDDLRQLVDAGYIVEIGEKIILISHWFQNNKIRPERMTTKYLRLLSYLDVVDPGLYVMKYPSYKFADICQSTDLQLSDKFPLDEASVPTTIVEFARKFQTSCDGKTEKQHGKNSSTKTILTTSRQMSAKDSVADGREIQDSLTEESVEGIKPPLDVGNKLFGIFKNVSLTTEQYEEITIIGKIGYIDRASSWYKKNGRGVCDYSTIINWISNDMGEDQDIGNLINNAKPVTNELPMTEHDIGLLKTRLKNIGIVKTQESNSNRVI